MSPRLMRRLRQLHLYFGTFFAPAILFFAFSGMLQTFDFHEARNHPPQWLKVIAQLHKKQDLPRPKPPRAEARPGNGQPRKEPEAEPMPSPLKVFTGIMSIALMLSTLLGIWIALSVRNARSITLILFALGTLLPIGMILL